MSHLAESKIKVLYHRKDPTIPCPSQYIMGRMQRNSSRFGLTA